MDQALKSSVTPSSSARIRAVGARATPARVRVLDLLSEAQQGLSHQDIERSLGTGSIDRVTLYRVLDWMVEAGLAHRTVDDQRVSRFSPAQAAAHDGHAHFRCEACGRVICLDHVQPPVPPLPAGCRVSRVELSVRGQCPACSGEGPP